MTTADVSWMPASGRHPVNIGTSLARALKARKGAPVAKRSTLPDRDFYSFRYNFKPESIDSTKPGFIEVKRGKDSTNVVIERPSTQAGEYHIFTGAEQPAKEWECVLIYDDETGTFTLEKLDSFMILNYDRKSTTSTLNRSSTTASPAQPAPPTYPTSAEPIPELDLGAQLEREIDVVDAEGEDDFEEIILRSQQETEDGEEVEIIPQRIQTTSSSSVQSSKSSSKARAASLPQPATKSKPSQSRSKAKQPKRDRVIVVNNSDVEEEELSFGQPARPAKRKRRTSGEGLAFPSSSKNVVTLPKADGPSLASDSEEDWDEIPAHPASGLIVGNADAEDGEEIDANAFEAEMNQELEREEDDFLANAVSSELDTSPSGQPISLNQYAKAEGVEASQDEDDYSSSEDSEYD